MRASSRSRGERRVRVASLSLNSSRRRKTLGPPLASTVRQQGHQRKRLRSLRARKLFGYDGHQCSERRGVKDLDDVAGTHPYATVAAGFAKTALLRRAVNIDAPPAGVLVTGLRAFQPEDPCHDGIAARGVNREYLAAEVAMSEHGAFRQIVAELAPDAKPADRSLVAAARRHRARTSTSRWETSLQ